MLRSRFASQTRRHSGPGAASVRVATSPSDWSPEQHEALTRDMLAISRRERDGSYAIPFGAIYLTARNAA